MNYKFKNTYLTGSMRLKNWDYSSTGYYFVTICTKDKQYYLGEIYNNIMKLSKIGEVAYQYWIEIPKHFPFAMLDKFVVMPNHLHGIIVIQKTVETQNLASLQNNKFGPQSKNLASIIRGYKIGVKKWATTNNIIFHWQKSYYDHVIRNEKSLSKIREYIINNSLKWELDIENKINNNHDIKNYFNKLF